MMSSQGGGFLEGQKLRILVSRVQKRRRNCEDKWPYQRGNGRERDRRLPGQAVSVSTWLLGWIELAHRQASLFCFDIVRRVSWGFTASLSSVAHRRSILPHHKSYETNLFSKWKCI